MSNRTESALLCCVLALLLLGGLWGAGVRLALAAPLPSPPPAPLEQKPLPPLQGGAWDDDLVSWDYLACPDTVDFADSLLYLKYAELLDWQQTWTAHFASGAFHHTLAISDSVQLARIPESDEYYTTGVYTSTVFDAGRPVDWAGARWRYAGWPEELVAEWRVGSTPHPDPSWSPWLPSLTGPPYGGQCAYTPGEAADCSSNLAAVPSARYLQYRCTFHASDARRTVALLDMALAYGTHYARGTAVSIPLSPIDVRAWQRVLYNAVVPTNTSLQIDILDGASDCAAPVLLADVQPGASLAAIDPAQHRSLRLRATLRTTDPSLSPALDLWGLRWEVGVRLHLPLLMRE